VLWHDALAGALRAEVAHAVRQHRRHGRCGEQRRQRRRPAISATVGGHTHHHILWYPPESVTANHQVREKLCRGVPMRHHGAGRDSSCSHHPHRADCFADIGSRTSGRGSGMTLGSCLIPPWASPRYGQPPRGATPDEVEAGRASVGTVGGLLSFPALHGELVQLETELQALADEYRGAGSTRDPPPPHRRPLTPVTGRA